MEWLGTAAGALAGGAVGGVTGFAVGDRFSSRGAWLYWLAYVLGVAAGVASAAFGLLSDEPWMWVGALALIGGWVTGLKYGYARNPGARLLREGVSRPRQRNQA